MDTQITSHTEQVLSSLQQFWGIVLVANSGQDEYTSSCPRCGDGGKGPDSDRFHVWTSYPPRWWCRKCNWKGRIETLHLPNVDTEEFKRARAALLAERLAQQITARDKMASCTDHIGYYHQLLKDPTKIALWTEDGVTMETIHQHKLGHCSFCPTDKAHRESLTIPVFANGTLLNIRHRLLGIETNKYRPHRKHLGQALFNSDALKEYPRGMLVEGEKKTLVVLQYSLPSVGVSGSTSFLEEWAPLFDTWDRVYVCFDPDAIDQAEETARCIGPKALVMDCPYKVDDFLLAGATRNDLLRMMKLARRVS